MNKNIIETEIPNLDIDELIRESAVVADKILLCNKIIGCLQEDENINYETASALVLPIYDYDKEYFKLRMPKNLYIKMPQ